jgi:hypothetical protein
MSYITPEQIYDATNGGLEIILSYYPQAVEASQKQNVKFKLRESEKTASANLRKAADGTWLVTDFGGDAKPKNAIAITMEEEKLEFYDAIQLLASRYGVIAPEMVKDLLRPSINKRPATEEEEEGKWFFYPKDFTEAEIASVFADKVRAEKNFEQLLAICKKFHFLSLEKYVIIKNREAIEICSTEVYPIFMWEVSHEGKAIKKIYQPKSLDKGKRFMYYGGKPDDFVFGFKQARTAYDELNKDVNPDYDALSEEQQAEERKEKKLPEVILATGGSDAMNVAALGYQVVWLNSESAKLTGEMFKSINQITDKFCILYDIDHTGRVQAHGINMVYLTLCQILLPDWLLKRKDWRGSPCKDVRDFLRFHGSRDFKKLVESALPYQFWDSVPKFDRKGEFIGNGYECNNTHLYHFLAGNGFFQMRGAGELDMYIKITGNIVEEVNTKDIKRFVMDFLRDRGQEVKLRNTFYNTTRLNATSFENLPYIELDFTDNGKGYQLMFFENATWRITKEGIQEFKPGELPAYVWEDEVIKHRVKQLDPFFKIGYDAEDNDFSISLENTDSMFFRFLINTAKVFWTIEEYGRHPNGQLLDRTTLTEEEIHEQNLHLINRIYALGYLLHRYKDDSRAWAVWAQEFKTIEDSVSDGGSGKSICLKFPRYFMKSETLPGRDDRMTENKHILENINEHTDYVMVDDCHEYLKFSFFYPMITGEWHINPKNTKSFVLSYQQGPKLAFSSNFAPHNADPSTERRLLYTLFSDYYHHGPSDSHPQERSPKDEFGCNLFTDFDEHEWNLSLNFGAQCLQFYLAMDHKINPPMDNVNARNLLAEMGMAFKDWADVYFSPESSRIDTEIVKDEAFDDCLKIVKNNKWTANKFKKALVAWCKFNHFKLNPKHLCTDDKGKRIIRKIDNVTKEMIYVETKPASNETTDLPF